MKTSELIELLKAEDQNAEVLIESENQFGTDVMLSIDAIYHSPGDLTHAHTIIAASLGL